MEDEKQSERASMVTRRAVLAGAAAAGAGAARLGSGAVLALVSCTPYMVDTHRVVVLATLVTSGHHDA